MEDSKKSGFTLIELLAVIVVLVLIFSITFFFSGNIFGGVADKVDKTTKKMILDATNEYVLEYRNKDWWKEDINGSGDITFCVSLESLLETGYYDSDDKYVLENKDKLLVSAVIDSKKVIKYDLIDYNDAKDKCNYSFNESLLDKDNGKIDIIGDNNEDSIGSLEYNVDKIDNNNYDVNIDFLVELGIDVVEKAAPVYVAIILDNSGSMVGNAWNNARAAAIKLSDTIINSLDNSYVALVQYNDVPKLARDFDNKVLSNNDFFPALGSTNVSGGIDLTSSLFNNLDLPKTAMLYTILLYDGEPTHYSYLYNTSNKKNLYNSSTTLYYDNFLTAFNGANKSYDLLYTNSTSISYVKNAGSYLINDVESKLITIGYNFSSSSDLKKVSSLDNKFCANSDYADKIYRDEDRDLTVDMQTQQLSYPFVYNASDGTISSSNTDVGTESYGYYELDLTSYKETNEVEVEFDFSLDYYNSSNYLYVEISQSNDRNISKFSKSSCYDNGKWINSSNLIHYCNTSSDKTKINLKGGKKYYIHLYYQKNSSMGKMVTINSITYTLSGQELMFDLATEYNDKFYLSTEEESRLVYGVEKFDNKLGLTAKQYNTTSGGYYELDLSDKEGTYLLTVNAKSNVGKGTIWVTESPVAPQMPAERLYSDGGFYHYYDCNRVDKRCIYGSTINNDFNFELLGGKKYYVHFINDAGSYNAGEYNFIINNMSLIKLGDKISDVSLEGVSSDSCNDDSFDIVSCLKDSNSYEYVFEYSGNESIISTNKEIDNSCSHSYIELDLSKYQSSEYVIVSFNSLISSEARFDFGNIIITESEDAPTGRYCNINDSSNKCILISSGSYAARNSYSKLLGGKKYYVHFTYCKDSSSDSGNDYFSINKINLYKGINNTDISFDNVVSYKNYTFNELDNKTLISTNNGVDNSKSHRYLKIDLTSYDEDERFLLEIDNFVSNSGYNYIYISKDYRYNYPSSYKEDIYYSYSYSGNSKSEVCNKIIYGGSVYYVHFEYIKYANNNKYDDIYRIDGIRLLHYVGGGLKSIDLSKNKAVTRNYEFVKDGDKYVSNNDTIYSSAYSYFEVDLTGYSSDKKFNVLINATSDIYSSGDYFIALKDKSIPIFSSYSYSCYSYSSSRNTNCRYLNKGTYDYTLSLDGGSKYYIHLLNSNDNSLSNIEINSINLKEIILDKMDYYCYYDASIDNINSVFSKLSNKVTESVPKLAATKADIVLTTIVDENVAFHIESKNDKGESELVNSITKEIDLSSYDLSNGTFDFELSDKYTFVLDDEVKCDEEVCTFKIKLFDIKIVLYYEDSEPSIVEFDDEMIPLVTIEYENGKAIN